ncbi:heat stress transcription factor B-4 [Heracleum sosnowskyi]|uniref:Heat stress transcription factor B-4 n=1 Tax=Heracleum sosnowskyi TaxID=360622 RepID=A0AAD8MYG0_9APIA|nr:heat stress transcription factor B-4 [Heracleum sosnowskyi]
MAALMLNNCDSILLSLDSHKSVPAPFLTKSYQLVDDPLTDHIVSWGDDHTTFVLNTYGFRKIVPDIWEFANEFFKKGEKHLLGEIHCRKNCKPYQMSPNLHSQSSIHHPGFFPYQNPSISPTNSDEQVNNWSCDSPPPLSSPTHHPTTTSIYNTSVTALSEDNERLRRSNNMLTSELAHMRKLYNDIIYFVQNHVKPVVPSNSYPLLSFYPMGVCSKKRSLQHEYMGMTTNKARFVLEKDDLGLNLMPPC